MIKRYVSACMMLTGSACRGPQTRHHLANILADHYKVEDMGFSMLQLGEA